MKKFPKIVQADSRGQIVIPKDIRRELGIDEGTGFYMYTITDEGILLKKIENKELSDHKEILSKNKPQNILLFFVSLFLLVMSRFEFVLILLIFATHQFIFEKKKIKLGILQWGIFLSLIFFPFFES